MNRKKVVTLIISLVLVGGLVAIAATVIRSTTSFNKEVTGRVSEIIKRPNKVEDGYYGITVRGDDGKEYHIDATAYMNNPESPASRGEACVSIPIVRMGDSVRFKLPSGDGETYTTCYAEGKAGYYFIVTMR